MLNVALPKGRLGEKVYDMFEKAGYECPSIREKNRKLLFTNEEKGICYFWVKPSDVAILKQMERVPDDVEYEPEVYELLDLDIGKCMMAVAAPNGYIDRPQRTLRVATKFERIAAGYYASIGRDIDIIHLNGSIELAPLLGLSDVIVDIVETGSTLKANNLSVVERIVDISARFIANKASYEFKKNEISRVTAALAGQLG